MSDRMKSGRKPDAGVWKYSQQFGVTPHDMWANGGRALVAQLDACSCDEARRLLLGVSQKEAEVA